MLKIPGSTSRLSKLVFSHRSDGRCCCCCFCSRANVVDSNNAAAQYERSDVKGLIMYYRILSLFRYEYSVYYITCISEISIYRMDYEFVQCAFLFNTNTITIARDRKQ